jgi:voltage-gated potassium channel
MTLRAQIYELLESSRPDHRVSKAIDRSLMVLIILNVIAISLETVEELEAVYRFEFAAFEMFSVAVFTVEYLLRLWVAPEHLPFRQLGPVKARLRHMVTAFAIIDLLAILPFYLTLLFPGIDLRLIRAFRLMRLLKLARYSPALSSLLAVLREERRALGAAALLMVILLMSASTVMYFIEHVAQPDKFGSIPDAMWWSIVALTTVGFGDVVPVTALGKIVGGFVLVMGLMMFALPVGIMASGFTNEVHRRQFVVSWGMVARVPLFSKLDAPSVSRVATLLKSKVVPAGAIITRRGDTADAMYFVAAGEVEVMVQPEPVILQEGDFFGEVALLRHSTRTATVRAVTEARLLVLSVDDFQQLMHDDPTLRETMSALAAERGRTIDAELTAEAAAPNGPRA